MDRKMLRDDQWERIEHLLPGKATDRGVTAKDNRRFVEAVLWIMRTGSPWRDLPEELGHWHRTFVRFSRWREKGVWERVAKALSGEADMEQLFIDSTIVRAHQHSAGAKKSRRSGHRPLAWWIDDQAACCGRCLGQSAAGHSLGGSDRGYRAGRGTDQGSACKIRRGRQRLRLGCLRRDHHCAGQPTGYPPAFPSADTPHVRSAHLQKSQSDRAFLQPHQAIQTHRHAIRQARQVLPVVRSSRLRFRLLA